MREFPTGWAYYDAAAEAGELRGRVRHLEHAGSGWHPATKFPGRGDDLRVRPSDSRAESQAGLTGPSGSLNPRPGRVSGFGQCQVSWQAKQRSSHAATASSGSDEAEHAEYADDDDDLNDDTGPKESE